MQDSRFSVLVVLFFFLSAFFSGCRNKIYESRTVVDVPVEMTLSDTVIPEYEMCVSPDGDQLVFPNTVYYHNVLAFSPISGAMDTIGRIHTRKIWHEIKVSYDRKYFAFRDDKYQIFIYDIGEDSLLLSSPFFPLGNMEWAYSNRMIFLMGEGGVIWLWDIIHNSFTNIPHEGFLSYKLRFSPDDRKLAVLSRSPEFPGSSLDVYDRDSGDWRHFGDHLESNALFCWASDSRDILLKVDYRQAVPPYPVEILDSLYVINTENLGKKPIPVKFEAVLDIVYSPEDKQVYLLTKEKNQNRPDLWRHTPETENEITCVAQAITYTHFFYPQFLVGFNGETALDIQTTGACNLDIFTISSHRREELTSGPYTDLNAIFTRDGKNLYFSRDDQLCRMELDTKWLARVLDLTGKPIQISDPFCCSPDGEDLTYSSYKGVFNLDLVDFQTKFIVNSENRDVQFHSPTWSSCGGYLACLDQSGQIHIFRNDGSENFPEIKIIPNRYSQIRWDPVSGFYGNPILCYLYKSGEYSIQKDFYLLDPWSEQSITLYLYNPHYSWCWHPDGMSILYSSEEGLKRRVLFTEMNE